jgi:ABC-2 type transport system ATP-binding protein
VTRVVEAPVTNGARQLATIVRDLDEAGVLIDDLAVRRPSLDDVFLSLTGRPAEDTPDPAALRPAGPGASVKNGKDAA